jgi:O-succinylbenzoic acid--CoA ligase
MAAAATVEMSAVERSTNWLADAAAARGGSTALVDAAGGRLTYAELHGRAAEAGAGSGPDVGLAVIELAPGIEHAIAVHAAMLSGRPSLTIRPGLPAVERELVLAAARSTTPAPGTLARVLSSGTSGARRPIDLSFTNFAASAASSAANLGVAEDDLWLACMPMDHVGGLSILIRSVIYGTAALVHPTFDVNAAAAALAGENPRVTIVSLVPTQLRRLLDAGADLSRLRVVLIGGAALERETLDRALDAGVPVVQSYGLTEACSQVCTLAPEEATSHRGSSGRALPGIEVETDAEGRIRVRGANVAAASADSEGWLQTGDLGRLDDDGFLWVQGRADDVIVSGGENVAPEPVEEFIKAQPGVTDAAVIGLPDPEWGQRVVAIVVAGADAEPKAEALIEACRRELAAPMVPKQVELAESLPRTGTGKVQRARLRAERS